MMYARNREEEEGQSVTTINANAPAWERETVYVLMRRFCK